jgi:Flp pilus assembly protein TadD
VVVVIASPPEGRTVRALCALLDEKGRLAHAHYADLIARQALEREVVAPLVGEGYRFSRATDAAAGRLLARGARAALATRGTLPREYYLGRHLLGQNLSHTGSTELGPRERASILARARELISRGAAERARLLLEGLLDEAPRDAEARGALGLCLLALGEPSGARLALERAVSLDPEQPAHLWNLAAAAHREGRPGACYLALSRFLASERFGALAETTLEERRRRAREYIAEYERLAQLEHPGVAPETVARAEWLYCEARLTLARGDALATIRALREVVERVPSHYGAWTHLGMAQGEIGHVGDARASLERALALRPGDAVAHDALRTLEPPPSETARRG